MKYPLLTAILLFGFAASAALPDPDIWDKKKKRKKDSDKIAYGLQVGVSYNNHIYGEVGLYKYTPGRFVNRTILCGIEATQISDSGSFFPHFRNSNFFAPKIGFHCQALRFLRFGSDLLVYTDFKTGDILPIVRPHLGASIHGNLFIIVGHNLNFFESHKWSPRIASYQLSVIYRLDLIKVNKKKNRS